MDPEPEPPAEPTPAAKGKPWGLIAGVALVAACCIGLAVKDNSRSAPEPAVEAPWTCARYTSEDPADRQVWTKSALTAMRRVDGLGEPTSPQVMDFVDALFNSCTAYPNEDAAHAAAVLYRATRPKG